MPFGLSLTDFVTFFLDGFWERLEWAASFYLNWKYIYLISSHNESLVLKKGYWKQNIMSKV